MDESKQYLALKALASGIGYGFTLISYNAENASLMAIHTINEIRNDAMDGIRVLADPEGKKRPEASQFYTSNNWRQRRYQ